MFLVVFGVFVSFISVPNCKKLPKTEKPLNKTETTNLSGFGFWTGFDLNPIFLIGPRISSNSFCTLIGANFDFGHTDVCPVLLGITSIQIKVNPTQVHDHQLHPVFPAQGFLEIDN